MTFRERLTYEFLRFYEELMASASFILVATFSLSFVLFLLTVVLVIK